MANKYAQNNTARLWLKYTSVNLQHELLLRAQEPASASSMLNMANVLIPALQPLMRALDSFISARFSAKGSNISLPVYFTPVAGTGDNSGISGDSESYYWDWVGRDQVYGAHVHWTFFTGSAAVGPPPTNRMQPGLNAKIDAVTAALTQLATTSVASERLVTVAQASPVVYSYVNAGYNSYWQRQQRG